MQQVTIWEASGRSRAQVLKMLTRNRAGRVDLKRFCKCAASIVRPAEALEDKSHILPCIGIVWGQLGNLLEGVKRIV